MQENTKLIMMKNRHEKEENEVEVRLDKWLWAARFYKTRSIAKAMIEGGKVHYNGQRAKVSKAVEIGAIIKLRQGNEEKEVEVLALSDQRRGAPEAQLLYNETEKSIKHREAMAFARKANALSMPHPDRRPNKKERRDLIKFKEQEFS
ncbi:Heat shock protein 15 [Mannheimia haemolytica]|nr:Heat shock protein 15 [Mannheimia haemolytica]